MIRDDDSGQNANIHAGVLGSDRRMLQLTLGHVPDPEIRLRQGLRSQGPERFGARTEAQWRPPTPVITKKSV
jgi:hypothetical protein